MVAQTFSDEHRIVNIIFNTPKEIMTTNYYQPGDPLYEN